MHGAMNTVHRIVVIRPGALGDTLLTLPALALLRQRWPRARLTYVGRRDTLPIVGACGFAGTTYPYDLPDWAALFADEPPAGGLLAETFRGCDVVVAWLSDADGAVARVLRMLGASRVVVAPGRPAADTGEHAALHLARTLAPLGIRAPDDVDALSRLIPSQALTRPALWVADTVASGAGAAGRSPLVAVHPGSGGVAKRWPPERFARIVERLADAGYTPLLVRGPQDEPVLRRVLDTLVPTVAPPAVVADVTLPRLAAALAGCAGFLGNDSGVSHLAGMLGIPVLALFGPTDPDAWSPLGPRVRTLRAASRTMDGLDVAYVWAALRPLLPDVSD